MKYESKNLKSAVIVLVIVFLLTASAGFFGKRSPHSDGRIFLYGESHGEACILEEEFRLWEKYYHEDGMRDLFVELPYYTAEFLNIWMQSEKDDILNEIFEDIKGTVVEDNEDVKKFYQNIKESCPETVFHGTDVGHQYDTTGKRYLEYLRANGEADSLRYTLAQQTIGQGKHFYEHEDHVYRENTMVENFVREFDKLKGADVMGIYGGAHTYVGALDYMTHSIQCMATQLEEYYGESLKSEDLTLKY